MTTASTAGERASRTMGHVALHYGRTEDADTAARLLEAIGYVKTQTLPLPDGSLFYRFVVDQRHHPRGDGIVFLSLIPPAQAALVEAARAALHIGTAQEHPSYAALKAAVDADPEYTFHLAVLIDSLEELERIVGELRQLNVSDPEMRDRLKIVLNRPRPGEAEIDARLDASPAFGPVQRYAYGQNGVQVFVETDILTSGSLTRTMVLELDYIFPGAKSHILSVVEL